MSQFLTTPDFFVRRKVSLQTLAVSGVIEHMELDKGLDMVHKAGVGEKNRISQKWLCNETNNQIKSGASEILDVSCGSAMCVALMGLYFPTY